MHSLFSYNNLLYYVQNKKLYSRSVHGDTVLLAELTDDEKIYHCRLKTGSDEIVFFTSPTNSGIINLNSVLPWSKAENFGPDTTRKFSEPPKGHICEYAIGRMWIAVNNNVFMSEPANPYLWDLFSGRFTFETQVTFIAGLENGVWVGTRDSVFWIASDGVTFERKMVTSYGVPEGKPILVDIDDLPLQLGITGVGYIALTNEGFSLLLPGGFYYNLTAKSVTLTDYSEAWSRYTAIKDSQYIYTYSDNGLGLCLNIRNLAVTQHNCYPFNSFTSLMGSIYGSNTDGIFKIQRGNIAANATFWINMSRTERIRFLQFHGEFSGSLRVTVKCDDGTTRYYIATPRKLGLKQHEFKIAIRRDNGIGTYYAITVENINGSDFSLDRIEITPIQRRLYRAA